MLGLPAETRISHLLPKIRMFEELELSLKQQQQINRDIAKMTFTNVISPVTIPSLREGKDVSAIYIVKADLRGDTFNRKTFEKFASVIPQYILYVLEHDGWSQLAVFYKRFFVSSPTPSDTLPPLHLEGFDLDTVWENLILNVGNFKLDEGYSLLEQIDLNARRDKIKAQLEDLQNRAYKAKQPHTKMELIQKINLLKKELE